MAKEITKGKAISKQIIKSGKTTIAVPKPANYELHPTDTFKAKFEKDKRNFFFR